MVANTQCAWSSTQFSSLRAFGQLRQMRSCVRGLVWCTYEPLWNTMVRMYTQSKVVVQSGIVTSGRNRSERNLHRRRILSTTVVQIHLKDLVSDLRSRGAAAPRPDGLVRAHRLGTAVTTYTDDQCWPSNFHPMEHMRSSIQNSHVPR